MSEKKIIILTGSEIRHEFFSKCLSSNDKINVAAIYCEGFEKSLGNTLAQNPESSDLEYQHFHARTQSELDFFNDGITSIDFVQACKQLFCGCCFRCSEKGGYAYVFCCCRIAGNCREMHWETRKLQGSAGK